MREGHAVVAALTAEARIAGFFASLYAAEEGLEGQVNSNGDVLQHLGMNAGESGVLLSEGRDCLLLIVKVRYFLGFLETGFARFQEVVVEPAALFQLLTEKICLFLGRIQAIAKGFTYEIIVCLKVVMAPG
ncbi:MAG TPA: hypothetical protein VH575_05755 [Gemmataceae bacterium]